MSTPTKSLSEIAAELRDEPLGVGEEYWRKKCARLANAIDSHDAIQREDAARLEIVFKHGLREYPVIWCDPPNRWWIQTKDGPKFIGSFREALTALAEMAPK